SNGMIANNAAIVAAAYEATGDFRFRKAALEGLDYLLGRNALGLSYVTGYGVRDVRNQHSRWFAHAVDPSLPNPPPGTLSGGPNSEVGDEVVNDLAGSPAQLCFRDDIASYTTNELTINWNAALAYLVAFASNEG
ncbi:MAG: glycoside hydrolase family 9 protein, partial [Promicromonosporaceae bacterium]|nr:glycoside hydrolase family 9 protein [Promicromonosporaceae bacterium]